jgi:hypothetical protein
MAGLMGLAAGFLTERWRRECAYLLAWFIAVILAVSLLPARDQRYVLLVAPAFVIAAAIGVASVAHYFVRFNPAWHVAALAIGLGMATWSAAHTRVSQISGFREIAQYLQEHAPKDAVLYEGHYDGVFGFYVRALDPNFERRMARADRILYEYGPANTFDWIQKSNVASADEAVRLLRTRSGCRWVAIEVRKNRNSVLGRRLLQEAVARPDFELVRSFPIQGARVQRVDLYRMVDDVDPVASLDLTFPSFSNKPFPNVVPISR